MLNSEISLMSRIEMPIEQAWNTTFSAQEEHGKGNTKLLFSKNEYGHHN